MGNFSKMGFYDLPKEERRLLTEQMRKTIQQECVSGKLRYMVAYFSDEDTYIRKAAYLAIGKIYLAEPVITAKIIFILDKLAEAEDFRIRQTAVNAAGEIGKKDFAIVQHFFDRRLFDSHHSVRNAVIGSVKKMGEVNPVPVLDWAGTYLGHQDKEIRREICHGIELRGRTHPQDILPLLKVLQFDKTSRVRKTLVHVIGQIAYKKGCLETVIEDLKSWDNKALVEEALEEIIDVFYRYRDFAVMSQDDAKAYIRSNYGK